MVGVVVPVTTLVVLFLIVVVCPGPVTVVVEVSVVVLGGAVTVVDTVVVSVVVVVESVVVCAMAGTAQATSTPATSATVIATPSLRAGFTTAQPPTPPSRWQHGKHASRWEACTTFSGDGLDLGRRACESCGRRP